VNPFAVIRVHSMVVAASEATPGDGDTRPTCDRHTNMTSFIVHQL
jgi:hypothetical protein